MTAQDLKNAILQLAMQGELEPQDPHDEPVSELIKEIKTQKERLIRENKIKNEKPLSPIEEEEYPFDIPESWGWIRLGSFCAVYNGDSINANVKQEKYSKPCNGWSFIATKDVGFDHLINYENGVYIPFEEETFKIAPSDSILLCMEGGSAGKKIGILDRDVCFGNKLCCFYPITVFNRFLYYYLQSPSFVSSFFGVMTGLIGGVGAAKLKNLIMPLPPLDEQRRIVARIEELMPLVEEYGKAEEQLTALNTEFPDKLRKSILQQAIQGKLTERDPADEPAAELLKRIRAEKEKLIKEGKIKKEKPLPQITEDEIPFGTPERWIAIRLGELATKITDGTHKTPKYTSEGMQFISAKDLYSGVLSFCNCKYISKEEHDELYMRCNPQKGDLLLTKSGSIGTVAIVDVEYEFSMFESLALVKYNQLLIYPKYLKLALQNACYHLNQDNVRGVAVKHLPIADICSLIVMLPPLAEQKRIVDRVNELLAMCDELKGCYE